MASRDSNFCIAPDEIRQLIPPMGSCFATDRITIDGLKVGYMYRQEPDNEIDSGWRFLSGDESQEYADMPTNWALYEVNTICNYDPAIIPHLGSPAGSAFGRIEGTDRFEEEELDQEEA
ncbi:DUF2185 domain-containing protein [Luteolibacter soli]|uniref:DUF2185 domain-containing protein n=1 Tax=Luteolibacter soli TaxID=3135280 RepID=A0ABU9AYM7_9BACT